MPSAFVWGCSCALAMVLCAVLEPSLGQGCSTEKMENITVDIRAALSKGIRGTDPIHTTSWETCVDVCCSGKEVRDKKCNLVVFNSRRKGNYPNCYLFYYPSNEPFPVNQSVGLVTGRILVDADVLKPTPISNKVSHFSVTEKPLPPPRHTPTKPPYLLYPLPNPTDAKREETAKFKNPNFKNNRSSQYANGTGPKQSDSSSIHTVSSSMPLNASGTIKHIVSILRPTIQPPPLTSGTPSRAVAVMAPTVSPSRAAATGSIGAYHRNTEVAAEPTSPTASQLATTSRSSNISHNLSPSTGPVTEMELELTDSVSVGVSGEEHHSPLGGKYILLATLLLGMMFLLLVMVQMGRKMRESLQRKRYTRLDYLINGMYANM